MLGVPCKHQLTAPVVIGIQEVRDRDDALRLGRMASFVNENVRKMITGETGRNQPRRSDFGIERLNLCLAMTLWSHGQLRQ